MANDALKQWINLANIIQNVDHKKRNEDPAYDVDIDTLIKMRTGMNVVVSGSSLDQQQLLALQENADLFNEKRIKVYKIF